MPYQLLALDMDGTVLTSEKVISPKTEEAIHAALSCGKDVFFATGRAPIEMKEHLRHFPEMRYVMYLSGAIVRDLQTGKDLHNVNIPLHIVEKIMDIGKDKAALVAIYAGDGLYVEKSCRGRMKEFGCECFEPLYEACAVWVDDIKETALAHGHEVHKINFYCGSETEWLRCAEELKVLPVSRASGIPNNEEISPLGVDKGTALRAMCEALGIPVEQSIAVGDQSNDLTMIRIAGLGVAMGNATEEVKAAADTVTADCDHDGVAQLIEQYLLLGRRCPEGADEGCS
ncbi:MAG: HAD family hydrolase [Oscillospiraceae bacterium]|nr:HAD family hydrolase [Oscillospiraceae bacterium]